jgi:hypothetical protein
MKITEIINEDWNKVNKQDKTDGLSQKAVNAYRRENPGSKLKTAVTTKPSKLKPGSKAAKRRKSFCARMSGNKGPMKKPNGKPTPKALALRRWNCESIEEMRQMIIEGEQMIAEIKKGVAEARNPEEFVKNLKKATKKKPKFQVGDWVTIDPNETAGWATSGMMGKIVDLTGDGRATINVNPGGGATGVQRRLSGIDADFNIRSSGTHTVVPVKMLELLPVSLDEQDVTESEDEEDYYYVVRHQTKRDIETEMPPKAWDTVGPKYATYEEAKEAFGQLKDKHPQEKFTYTRHPRISNIGGKPKQVFPEGMAEGWSQKYKSSINCSHPKGFSQKAHCAGKKKHNESMATMEATCPDCGMCESHGNLNEIKKGAKDSNGVTKCWSGYHAAGTKKSATTGKQVRNCVPNESVELEEKWTQKYKSSINCSNPKGFSQKAHCASKKK